MAIPAALSSCKPIGTHLPYPSNAKTGCNSVVLGGFSTWKDRKKWPGMILHVPKVHNRTRRWFAGLAGEFQLSPSLTNEEADSLLLSVISMNFFDRLNLAWKIVFPSTKHKRSSNARIAKQRLKMILFSDRCAVNDEAKRKIVTNIVDALSEFVEIESQDKVQLSVSTDTDLGAVYSVTVPVRRVKPEYQDSEEVGSITNIEYRDRGETTGTVDVRFDFFVPEDRIW